MRTAAIVGTASVVGGSVAHHQQQKYARQDAEAAQQPRPNSNTRSPLRSTHRRRPRPPQTTRRTS